MTRGFSRTEFNWCHSLSNFEFFYHPKIMSTFAPWYLWSCSWLQGCHCCYHPGLRYSAQPHFCLETNFRNWYLQLREKRREAGQKTDGERVSKLFVKTGLSLCPGYAELEQVWIVNCCFSFQFRHPLPSALPDINSSFHQLCFIESWQYRSVKILKGFYWFGCTRAKSFISIKNIREVHFW